MGRHRKKTTLSNASSTTRKNTPTNKKKNMEHKRNLPNLPTAEAILLQEKLHFSLLHDKVYVDMKDVTVNVHDYLNISSTSSKSHSKQKNTKNVSSPARNLKKKLDVSRSSSASSSDTTNNCRHGRVFRNGSVSVNEKKSKNVLLSIPRATRATSKRNQVIDISSESDTDIFDESESTSRTNAQATADTASTSYSALASGDDDSSVEEVNLSKSALASKIKNIESSLPKKKFMTKLKQDDKTKAVVDSESSDSDFKRTPQKRKLSTTKSPESSKNYVKIIQPATSSSDSDFKKSPQKLVNSSEKGTPTLRSRIINSNDSTPGSSRKRKLYDSNVSDRERKVKVIESPESSETENTVIENGKKDSDNDSGQEMSDSEDVSTSSEDSKNVSDTDADKPNMDEKSVEVEEESTNVLINTDDLIDILAGTEVPEADDADSELLNDTLTSEGTNQSIKSIEKIEASKKLTAESIKLIRKIDGDTDSDSVTDSPIEANEQVETNAPELVEEQNETEIQDKIINHEESMVVDKGNSDQDQANSSVLNTATKKKKRSSFKLRFSKSFTFSEHTCKECDVVFKKQVDLDYHCLQHLDNRKLSVSVYRTILPRKYDTSCGDINKYLNPKKRPSIINSLDVDLAKSLISKYCGKNDLSEFDTFIEGDISMNRSMQVDSLNESSDAGNKSIVNVISDITIQQTDKPEHVLEIDEDQLESVTVSSARSSPDDELVEDSASSEEEKGCNKKETVVDLEITPENKGDNSDVVIQSEKGEAEDENIEENEEETTSKSDESIVDEGQVNDKETTETKSRSAQTDEENQDDKPEEPQNNIIDDVVELTDDVEQNDVVELNEDVEQNDVVDLNEYVEQNDVVQLNDDVEQNDVVENDNLSDNDKENAPQNEEISEELNLEVENSKIILTDGVAVDESKKRKHDTVEKENEDDHVNKKTKLADSVDDLTISTDEFESCVDAMSPTESPSKYSDTSENENPEFLMKLQSLDNQLKTIMDTHKAENNDNECLNNTMTQEEMLESSGRSDTEAESFSTQCSVAL